eukprot:jgi/Mesen1/10245/ME000774S09593
MLIQSYHQASPGRQQHRGAVQLCKVKVNAPVPRRCWLDLPPLKDYLESVWQASGKSTYANLGAALPRWHGRDRRWGWGGGHGDLPAASGPVANCQVLMVTPLGTAGGLHRRVRHPHLDTRVHGARLGRVVDPGVLDGAVSERHVPRDVGLCGGDHAVVEVQAQLAVAGQLPTTNAWPVKVNPLAPLKSVLKA